ncbi:endopeptidase La [Mycoplasmopsis felifaucium]|uniref:endopeptidase La n=1 Tax=Mycoplasmopsis felifaucium TaxID=35768 RepID=UPI0038CDA27B
MSTLVSVESIKTGSGENSEVYFLELKAISKYWVTGLNFQVEEDENTEVNNEENTNLIDVVSANIEKASNKEDMFSPALLERMKELEEILELLSKNSDEWMKIQLIYLFMEQYTADEIDAINTILSKQKMNEYQQSFAEDPIRSFIKILTNLVAITPREKYKVYSSETISNQLNILENILSITLESVRLYAENTNNINLVNVIDSMKSDKFFQTYKNILKTNAWVQKDYEFELENSKNLANMFLQQSEERPELKAKLGFIISSFKPIDKMKTNKSSIKNLITEEQVEKELNEKIKTNLDKQQKEFLLREKMKAIKESLSENDENSDDEDEEFSKILKDPVLKQIYPDSVLKLIKTEKEKLKNMMSASPEANITATYINQIKKLPWRKVEVETLDIKKAREILDKNHYGLKEVKERIIEYLSLIINHKNINKTGSEKDLINIDNKSQIDLSLFKEDKNQKIQKKFNNVPILTLVGPPGTGKTSLARAIAEALNKSYVKISLGGVHDEAEIRGHRKTYVGAMPGKIIKAIQSSGVSNPLILLDEIDKMASDIKGDPASAMLEVLDPEQNTKFQDNYIEHEYDLSKVLFIATANYYENIPAPLIDRVEIIELNSYTTNEKIKIANEHLIDAVVEQAGLKPEQFQISDKTLEYIIKHYTAEAGVRGLKRLLDKIARKIVTQIVDGKKIDSFIIDDKIATEFLGTPKISESEQEQEPQIGSVNGLAYTSIGGTTLQIEVSAFKSKQPGIKLTGSLKEVMQESAKIALSYVRSNAEKFGIKDFEFDEYEIHVHVPEGAVPKDGPSAGVTFTTALISALSKKPVSPKVAMTGEITLRGKVLEIGGLKEKSFAAYKKGVKTVFIPKANEKNLVDIPDEVKEQITFKPVQTYDEIYEFLFDKKD